MPTAQPPWNLEERSGLGPDGMREVAAFMGEEADRRLSYTQPARPLEMGQASCRVTLVQNGSIGRVRGIWIVGTGPCMCGAEIPSRTGGVGQRRAPQVKFRVDAELSASDHQAGRDRPITSSNRLRRDRTVVETVVSKNDKSGHRESGRKMAGNQTAGAATICNSLKKSGARGGTRTPTDYSTRSLV